MAANDFDVWAEGAPLLTFGDGDFGVWADGAPILENSEVNSSPPGSRRRVFIF